MTPATTQTPPVPPPVDPTGADGAVPPGPSTRSKVMGGGAVTIAGYMVNNGLRLGSNVVLAALLFKEHFGVMALAATVLAGLQMFADIGIGPSIIQSKRGEDRAFLNTAWSIQIFRSIVLWIAACALAWPMAAFYKEPALLWLLPFAAVSVLISGFNSTSWFTANRRLALFKLVAIDVGGQIAAIATMVTWALIDPSPYALAAGAIVGNSVKMVATHTALGGWVDRLGWDRSAAHELVHFGKWIFLSTAVTFLWFQADRFVVAKLFSVGALGVYSIALQLARMPIDVVTKLTGIVLFPLLSQAGRDDPAALRTQFYKARELMLPPALTTCLGIALLSPPFFELLYKEEFHDAVWITPALSLAIWFEILQVATDRVLLSIGDTRGLFVSNLLRAIIGVGGAVAGFYIGQGIHPTYGAMGGFIAGITLGSLAGHVWVEVCCHRAGLPIVGRDAAYTGLFLALVGVGFGVKALATWAFPLTGHWATIVEKALPACVVVAIPGVWTLRRLLPMVKRRA